MDTWDTYMTFQYKSASKPQTPRNHSPKIAPCQRTLRACMHWWRIWYNCHINVFPTLWSIIQSNCIPTTCHAILDIRIQYHRGNHQCLHSGTRSQCITCTWSWLAARINFMIRRWDFLVIKGPSSKESSTGTLQCAQLNSKLDSYDTELGLWDWPMSYALLLASVKEQTCSGGSL